MLILGVLVLACGEPTTHVRTPAHKPLPARVAVPDLPPVLPTMAPAPALPAAPASIRDLSIDGLDALVTRAIKRGELPGCVIAIGDRAGIRWLQAYGERTASESMTVDTRFDLASLTKPVATAASIMGLSEQGRVKLDAPASSYVRELSTPDKRNVRVSMLLLHTSGLPSVNGLDDYEHGHAHAITKIAHEPLISTPGLEFRYSDLNFILLGEIVARVSGQPLDQYAKQHLFAPLGMLDTTYMPPLSDVARTAPTEERDEQVIRGVVDDPRAYRMGGVAGHAGLFSTATDLSRFARMILGEGELEGTRILSPATVRSWIARRPLGRTLGFDANTGYSDAKGKLFSSRAIGHGGYTGTSLWIDPARDLFVVLLSNRVHAGPKGTIHPLASAVADLAAEAQDREHIQNGKLETGIDVLASQAFARLRGPAIALLTHEAARDSQGRSTLDLLTREPGIIVRAILAPEHGLQSDREGHVADARFGERQIAVHSLFGKKRRPSAEMLAGMGLIVIDLVDVGARFYTYMATALATIEAASAAHIPVMVLDRPNPIGGIQVEGPMSELAFASFVNYHPLPLRHGMTAGELLQWLVRERGLSVDLEVVRMRGYRRDMLFSDTGLTWSPPSPNLKRAEQALLYPAVALLEGTNVSVGRGTKEAFEVIGAPFVDGAELSAALSALNLAGVRISPTRFTPRVGPYAGTRIPGVKLTLQDPRAFLAAPLGLALLQTMADLYPEQWDASRLDRMLANASTLAGLRAHKPTAQLISAWQTDLEKFAKSRNDMLLY